MSDLVNPTMNIFDKIIRLLPTEKKKLEKYEYLKDHIDYENGKDLIFFLEERRRKVLFKMSTGLNYNEKKNVALFEFLVENIDMENLFNPRLAKHFELRDNQLCVIENKSFEINKKLYFLFWKGIIIVCFILMILSVVKLRNHIAYAVFEFLLFLIVMLISIIMIGNKQRDMNFIKSFKKRYNPRLV